MGENDSLRLCTVLLVSYNHVPQSSSSSILQFIIDCNKRHVINSVLTEFILLLAGGNKALKFNSSEVNGRRMFVLGVTLMMSSRIGSGLRQPRQS